MDPDDSTDGHSDDPASPISPVSGKEIFRKRSSRACDQCRKAKSRCDPAADDGPCKSCVFSGTACTFEGPSQKRGPPKGYLNALETRLHEAEALLGAIIASPQAEGLVGILSKDPLAGQIITRVNKSVFGALGRPRAGHSEAGPPRSRRRPDKARQRMTNNEVVYSRESGSPVFKGPSYAWQDHLTEQLAAKDHSSETTVCEQSGATSCGDSASISRWEGDRRRKRRMDLGRSLRLDIESVNNQHQQEEMYTASSSVNADSPDLSGFGQLSLDKDLQVRYLGQSSGLTILSQCPRTDALYSQQIWRLKPAPMYGPATQDGVRAFDQAELQVRLPCLPMQEHLLRQYFHYVHPILPIVDRDDFWDKWTSLQKFESGGPSKVLLLAMFALAARYSDPEHLRQLNQDMVVDENSYVEEAQALLNKPFGASRLPICQALLLLGYRAIGISGLTDASLSLMMGIQMAVDLGLNRHADQWARDGSCVFSENMLKVRRSVWYGFVVLDTYIAAQLGRPLRIHREDYDTRLPDVDTQEDFQLWMPYRNTSTAQGYNPLPGRITSCFRSSSSIAELCSQVLHRLYTVSAGWTTAQRHAESIELDQKLQRWYVELPEMLRGTTAPAVPPPHVLCLHMAYWCSVLLLQQALLPHEMRSIHSPDESARRSSRALDLGAAAASNITNLVQTYNSTFGLRDSPPLLIYHILVACVMHVAILQIHPDDVQAKLGLTLGINCLDEIKETWPAASHACDLLRGADVNKKPPPIGQSDQSRKRPLEESPSVTSAHSQSQSQTRTHSQSQSQSQTRTHSHSQPHNHSHSHSSPGSPSQQSTNELPSMFHPSQFMELTHSLGLDPSGLNSVFDIPTYGTWPSNDAAFNGLQGDMVRNSAILLGHKGPG